MNSMNRVNRDGRPISARDHHANDPDYIQWQKEYEAEQKAAQAADPEFQFKQAANAAAEANRHGVLTMPMNEAYLATFGTIVRPPFDESKVAYFNQSNASAIDTLYRAADERRAAARGARG
jgi:cytosine/adenosine deaminase-related metal-dependent hydrolase